MAFDPSMLNIGTETQLFVDDLVIESVQNVCRTWHAPERVGDRPLIAKDRPWEHIVYTNCSDYKVIYDPDEALFKCWYADLDWPEVKPGEPAVGKSVYNMLYAQSKDGLHWEKPELGLHRIDGRDTNIVYRNAHALGILLDPFAAEQASRYKMVFTLSRPGGDVSDVVAATSPEGIRWELMQDRPVMGRHGSRLDDVILLDHDPCGRIYIMSTRHYDMYAVSHNLKNPRFSHWTLPFYPADWRRMNKRRIWQSESADFIHWSEPYVILSPEDGADGLDETFYGLCQFAAGGVRLGLMTVYHYVSNTQQVRLVYSRNGKQWRHLNGGRPFLAPGREGAWDCCSVMATSRPIPVGDELYIYHGGASCHHDWWCTGKREGVRSPETTDRSLVRFGLGLATMRRDGYVSLDAGHARPGIVVTRPLISGGTELVVNARCHDGGSVAVEVVDHNDDAIPGFGRGECDVFAGDGTEHTVSWQGKCEIPVISTERAQYPEPERARLRKVRFYMEHAELYSFRLTA